MSEPADYQGRFSIEIISIANPAAPVIVKAVDTPGAARDVGAQDGYLFVADGAAGVQVIDARTVSTASIIGGFDTPGNACGIAVNNVLVYVADEMGGIHSLNAASPAFLYLERSFPSVGGALEVCVLGHLIAVANGAAGITLLYSPVAAGTVMAGSGDKAILVDGSLAYLVSSEAIVAVDLINSMNPLRLGQVSPIMGNGFTGAAVLPGGYVFSEIASLTTSHDGGTQEWSFANPNAPTGTGASRYLYSGSAPCSANYPGRIYVADAVVAPDCVLVSHGTCLAILEKELTQGLWDPAFHRYTWDRYILGMLGGSGGYSMALASNFLFSISDSLRVVDVRDRTAPRRVSACAIVDVPPGYGPFVSDLALSGEYLYVATEHWGLTIVDIANVMRPSVVATLRVSGCTGQLAVVDDVAYVGCSTSVVAVDIFTPRAPSVIGNIPVSGAKCLAAYGNSLLVSGRSLQVLALQSSIWTPSAVEISGTSTPEDFVAFPNPSSGSVAFRIRGEKAIVEHIFIFDVAGRLVRALEPALALSGGHETNWDGCDSSGRMVAAGIYFARTAVGGRTITARVLLVR